MTTGQNQTQQDQAQQDQAQQDQAQPERRLSPADLQHVQFARASMLRPGYVDTEVDRVMSRAAEELGRLIAEKAALRDQVRALQSQLEGAAAQPPPSDQAVRILASAQQTADNYVAEAEEFSRQMTSEARAEYEEQVRQARENAGAIIQAAQEAAAKIGSVPAAAGADDGSRTVEELQQQVAYLKTFGQAVRAQLRSYLEALISDVETEWGRADPAALPRDAVRPPVPRSAREPDDATPATFVGNTAAETPPEDNAGGGRPATAGSRSST
jgi:DivIVA domain-containing protein